MQLSFTLLLKALVSTHLTTCHFTLPWEGREERAGRETAATDIDFSAVFNAATPPLA